LWARLVEKKTCPPTSPESSPPARGSSAAGARGAADAPVVPARVVMEVLGHSQIGVTMNVYSHVMPTQLKNAADAMTAALWDDDGETG
jgi:integrase